MKKIKDLIPWKKKNSPVTQSVGTPSFNLRRRIDDFFDQVSHPDVYRGGDLFGGFGFYPKLDIIEGKKEF